MRRLAPMLLVLLPACSPFSGDGSSPLEAPRESGPASADELAVQAFVAAHADDPKAVTFSRWGPDVTGDIYRALLKMADGAWASAPARGPSPAAGLLRGADRVADVVRVRYATADGAGAVTVHDRLFYIGLDGSVAPEEGESGDDHWFEALKARLMPPARP